MTQTQMLKKVRRIHRLLKLATRYHMENKEGDTWMKGMDSIMEARRVCAEITKNRV